VATLCLWVTELASPPRLLSLGTCKVYLTAVVHRHLEMGFVSPLVDAPPILDRVLAGIKRATSHVTKPKLPITTAMLRSMQVHLRLDHRRDCLVWAMMWTATAGLLRISEFTTNPHADSERTLRMCHLRLVDGQHKSHSPAQLASTTPQPVIRYASLRLEASKTDPLRLGVDVIISSPAAVAALCSYTRFCTAHQLSSATPLFHFSNGVAVHRQWFMKQVDVLLRRIQHDPRLYSSHSFRKGGAVSLQEEGVEDSLIRRTGRWKSDAFNLYVRHPTLDSLVESNALI
jgi:hypothetical protein